MRPGFLLVAMVALAWPTLCEAQQVAEEKNAARVDRHGDPLPAGAIQRFGTSRFWAEHYFMTAAISPDGKLIASGHDKGSLRL